MCTFCGEAANKPQTRFQIGWITNMDCYWTWKFTFGIKKKEMTGLLKKEEMMSSLQATIG